MRPGATIGMAVCTALTSAAGAAVAFVAALFVCPPLLMARDVVFGSTRDAPPFRRMEPMPWLLPASAVVGACAGALLATLRLRGGTLADTSQEPASGDQRDRAS